MQDNSNMFEDFNFKLIVIDALLDKECSFENDLNILKEKYVDNYEWHSDDGIIKEILSFFENLVLTEGDLKKVIELCFDGGNEIYLLLQPDGDGEDDIFDIFSVKGFKRLVNLKSVTHISLCDIAVLEPFTKNDIEVN